MNRRFSCRSPKYFFFEIIPFIDSAYGLTGRRDFLITLSLYPNSTFSFVVNEALLLVFGFAVLWVYSESTVKPTYYIYLVPVMSIRSVDPCPVFGTVQVIVVNYDTYLRIFFIL